MILETFQAFFYHFRYFAYVAKDKHTDQQMCHILESVSQAHDIANALRDTFNQTLPVGSYEQNEYPYYNEPLYTPNAHAAVTYTNTEECFNDMYISKSNFENFL